LRTATDLKNHTETFQTMTKFSIIVPTYNRTEFLEEALLSVINQTFDDYEVLIINDGSSEEYCKKLTEFSQMSHKIRKIDLTENRGLSYGRNKGVKEAKGKYIIFLDDDDTLHPNMLEKSNGEFINDCDVDIIMCKGKVIIPEETPTYKHFVRKRILHRVNRNAHLVSSRQKSTFFFLLYTPLINSFVYKREVLLKHPFPNDLKIAAGEDTYLWIYLTKQKVKFKNVSWLGAYYRVHEVMSSNIYKTNNGRKLYYQKVKPLMTSCKEKYLIKKLYMRELGSKNTSAKLQRIIFILKKPGISGKQFLAKIELYSLAKLDQLIFKWRAR